MPLKGIKPSGLIPVPNPLLGALPFTPILKLCGSVYIIYIIFEHLITRNILKAVPNNTKGSFDRSLPVELLEISQINEK